MSFAWIFYHIKLFSRVIEMKHKWRYAEKSDYRIKVSKTHKRNIFTGITQRRNQKSYDGKRDTYVNSQENSSFHFILIILRYIYFFRFVSFESSETKLKIKITFGNLWLASFEYYRENTIDPFLLNFEFLC